MMGNRMADPGLPQGLNIVQLTPGAGGMYCGGCFRDNALVKAWRRQGHQVLMVPLYLPLKLDEADQSGQTPVFFSGINVYLEQRFPWFSRIPRWLNRLLASRPLLRRVGKAAAKTRPEDAGELALSMLRGEEGLQARELEELIAFLKTQPPPDFISLSNALLTGMARRLKAALNRPVICSLQGEDGFVDSMPTDFRVQAWDLLRERAQDIDLFISPTEFYAGFMRRRLRLPDEKIKVVYNGLELAGYAPATQPPAQPAIGFFARMCPEKGLDLLVEAYLIMRHRNRFPGLQLRIGGSLGPADQPFVDRLESRLKRNGAWADVRLAPNLDREAKLDFYRSLTLFSVPAICQEAFGLYVIEALASGVPVVLPRHAAFPELVFATGGGVVCEPGNPNSLADALELLLLNPDRLRAMGETGRRNVLERFDVERTARELVAAVQNRGQPVAAK